MSTPALSPRLREPSHSTQSQPRARPAPMTRASTSRIAGAQLTPTLNPRRMNDVKTPSLVTQDPRTPSPNYFGLTVNPAADCFASSAAQHIRGNWSPPSSNVRSTAAASPRVIPVDQNPEFEQFRRQTENNKGFALGTFGAAQPSIGTPTGPLFGVIKPPLSPKSMATTTSYNSSSDAKDDGIDTKPRSPKRLLSTESPMFLDRPRRNSPASFEGYGRTEELAEFVHDRHDRPSLPPKKAPTQLQSHHRAETLPLSLNADAPTDGPIMATPQHIVNILESALEEVLLLDVRVSTQYARSRIAGALSLCIPTTLLKRPTFNVQKLAETFKDDENRQKFEKWRSSKYIVVYDSSSAQIKDAATCINTLKKFTNENWSGGCYIIRGGFIDFANRFPAWVSSESSHSPVSAAGLRLDGDLPSVAPVIGGCPMPATQNAANPFFGNIRQNMDLIGGVGQLSIQHPAGMTASTEEDLPAWLRQAVNERDHGKVVSEKFLQIERREQKRMQEALSGNVIYGSPSGRPDSARAIQIAGIEKGSKNRYNNIWPYEHSRVKLEGVVDGGCDYVNANHIQPAWSNKRYVATQGPLPATFNDFWNMVWQQDIRVVVMLTSEKEGGQIKAHNYWSDRQYGQLYLNPLGERRASLEPSRIHKHRDRPALGQRRSTTTHPPRSGNAANETSTSSPTAEQPYVIVRKFTLSKADAPFERMREITQLQYSSWPDFGAPAHPAHLLGLIEQCDAVVRQVNGTSASSPDPPNSRPVLVHCSAGCGRTGTFCTVDSVLDMLKRQRQTKQNRKVQQGKPLEVDTAKAPVGLDSPFFKDDSSIDGNWTKTDTRDLIEKTVEDFRLQRLSMVQSLRQFVLCYESVLEWLVEQHPKSA
ncbi:tyrosine-protein phosphatase-like protein non-receptor [Amniculicola lignicola CBS 123094]|uniref:protein-tyrosine-phosphatase n=1 Tax=Amniculicola lignicola CBS 123094 TaxID=1392246 RepID=A0A6A5WEK4_9PLEO|nr:tyrosine-protein phosphatase-like protein non-receptor [Amniculicola lignicola CBS 123094]